MTDVELDALEEAARAATPGPWKHYNCKGNDCVTVSGKVFLPRNELSVADTAFIAAANPAVVLDLIAELQQARQERDWLARALSMQCPEHRGSQVWLNIAKEAVCKN